MPNSLVPHCAASLNHHEIGQALAGAGLAVIPLELALAAVFVDVFFGKFLLPKS